MPTLAPARPLLDWLAVGSLTAGVFAIVTSEILPIGLLPEIGADFGVSDGVAGLTMTLPGLVAAVAAPAVTLATARVDRRVMLCLLMAVLAVADVLAALARSYEVMLVSRVLVGFTIGGFWSIGAGLAGRIVAARSVATATALIFSAVPLGSVLGVPLGTLFGQLAGWRAAFWALAALAVLVLVALLVLLPPLPAHQVTSARVLLGLLRGRATALALLATALLVLAHFGTYTYVAPFLREVAGLPPAAVSAVLLAYGVAGIAGNFLTGLRRRRSTAAVSGGRVAAAADLTRDPRRVFAVTGALIAAATLLLPLAGDTVAGTVGLLVLWGLAYGAVPVCSQALFLRAAPHAPEAATVLFTSSFQATFAVGALLGGVVVDTWSVSAVMVCGGLVAAVMAMVTFRAR
ncbi:MFS transporter [Nonomuraea longicatena]|uniref:MFS transporter n=1 Tax=Nonomuraea longicatena TaxID=83682 RepID=A0ABN1QCZ4_9ACTN